MKKNELDWTCTNYINIKVYIHLSLTQSPSIKLGQFFWLGFKMENKKKDNYIKKVDKYFIVFQLHRVRLALTSTSFFMYRYRWAPLKGPIWICSRLINMEMNPTVEAGFEPATYKKTGSQDQRATWLRYSTYPL